MAIKVAVAAALLVALVAVASASTYTTTVTTTTYEEDDSYKQCKQQVQGREFRACQSYLKQRSSPYNEIEQVVDVENPQQREEVRECCEQLKQMDRQQCGCEAIKQAVKQVQEGGSSRTATHGQSEQILSRARALPRMCGLSQQECRFNVVFV